MLNNRTRVQPLVAGLILAIWGLTAVIGWYWQWSALAQLVIGPAAMALPTALCFVLAGTALSLQALRPTARIAALPLGAAIILIAGGNLIHVWTGLNFGIAWQAPYQWFDKINGQSTPMSIPTALAFLLAGVALCISSDWRYTAVGVRALGLCIGAIGGVALLGYVLRLGPLYNWYFFSYMALHTAAGMVVLGAGLWLLHDGKRWLAQREDGGVVAITVIVLLVTAISIGIAAWTTEQSHLVSVLGDGLRLALRSRIEQFSTIIEMRSTRAAIIANRPNLLKNLRVLAADRTNRESIDVIDGVLHSFDPFGFSAIAVYGPDRREIAHSGQFFSDAELTVPLASRDAEIFWHDGFYLRRRILLSDGAGALGELVAEQPLQQMTAAVMQLDAFGRGDELLLCAEKASEVLCFPSAAAQHSFVLPQGSADRTQLAAVALAQATGIATIHDFRNRQIVAAYGPIDGSGLIAILKSDTRHLYQPLLNQFQRTVLLLFALIALGTALIYTRVRPLVRALRLSERRLQLALEASGSHVWDFDFRSNRLLPSASLMQQLGFERSPHPIALEKWRACVHPDDLAAQGDDIEGTRALLLQERGVEVRLLDNSGAYRWYFFRGGVVETDIDGAPLRALGTATDIDDRKQMEQQLIAARIAADDANHAKSLFLSSMSHELRTPLNGVLGYAQILLDSPTTSAEQRRQLSAIESCGQHLLSLINDVLDLSKIESGNIEIEHNNCNLYHLLEGVSDIVRQRAQIKSLQYILEIDKSVPPFVRIDDIKLRQILVNLLGNAVKFTQKGNVTLRVSTRAATKELIFQVRDTGIGIPVEKQKEIFQPFRQVGRSAGGTGLGLSISQRLSEAMGGMLLVQSSVDKGSCFSLSLPLELGEVTKIPVVSNFSHPTLDIGNAAITVMVADDNAINRQVLASILRANGIDVVEAENGQEVLDKLRQRPLPLVLMDVRMPVLDGFAATRAIKADPELHATKVIVVSASVSAETITDMNEVGCDDFIKKPVRVRELLEKIAEHLHLPLREALQNDRENQSS